jgi:hypothetical protein
MGQFSKLTGGFDQTKNSCVACDSTIPCFTAVVYVWERGAKTIRPRCKKNLFLQTNYKIVSKKEQFSEFNQLRKCENMRRCERRLRSHIDVCQVMLGSVCMKTAMLTNIQVGS